MILTGSNKLSPDMLIPFILLAKAISYTLGCQRVLLPFYTLLCGLQGQIYLSIKECMKEQH